MSKSKGEFLTVSLLEEKGYDPMVYRLFCLGSHYRKSLVFSFENLDNAAASYKKLVAKIAALLPERDGAVDKDAFDKHRADFCAALDNDLNTSLAVTALYDVLKAETSVATKLALIAEFDKVLTLNLISAAEKLQAESSAAEGDEDTAWIRELIEARTAAKKAKNFAEADRIRDELAAKGVTLIDTREGTKFEIKA
ncbi:MAG: cysteine--tRNA ligase, partial [Clostridia bacterium]|nr:cysteine--tRNA ligase [Clostridia bacterium]